MGELILSLEWRTGLKSSFIFAQQQEDIELEGSNYPWRTGLVHLNTFRISQVPLRRSNLIKFPRETLAGTVVGLCEILRQYESLPLWDSSLSANNEQANAIPNMKQHLEIAANRRSVLLALPHISVPELFRAQCRRVDRPPSATSRCC